MPADPQAFALQLPADVLAPLVLQVVAAAIAELDRPGPFRDRMAIGEAEAAPLLSLRQHQLRDLRLAGRISFSRGPRNTVLYTKSDLAGYLTSRREGPAENNRGRRAAR